MDWVVVQEIQRMEVLVEIIVIVVSANGIPGGIDMDYLPDYRNAALLIPYQHVGLTVDGVVFQVNRISAVG